MKSKLRTFLLIVLFLATLAYIIFLNVIGLVWRINFSVDTPFGIIAFIWTLVLGLGWIEVFAHKARENKKRQELLDAGLEAMGSGWGELDTRISEEDKERIMNEVKEESQKLKSPK